MTSRNTICLANKATVLPVHGNLRSRTCLNLGGSSQVVLQCLSKLRSRQPMQVHAAGGKGMKSDDEGSPWQALNKAMDKFKGPSIEDVLRQQIEKNKYYVEEGGGGKPPGVRNEEGGGGKPPGVRNEGGGGSGDRDFGETVDEAIQVFLAVLGLILMYAYLLKGDLLIRLAKDYMKYLFGGKKSVRLRRIMYELGQYFQKSTKNKVVDEYRLEKAILGTQTWWDGPEKYRHVLTRKWRDLPAESRRILRSLGLDLGQSNVSKEAQAQLYGF